MSSIPGGMIIGGVSQKGRETDEIARVVVSTKKRE